MRIGGQRQGGQQQLGPFLLTAAGTAEPGACGQPVYSVQMMLVGTQPGQRTELGEMRKSRKPDRETDREKDLQTGIRIVYIFYKKKPFSNFWTMYNGLGNTTSQIQACDHLNILNMLLLSNTLATTYCSNGQKLLRTH